VNNVELTACIAEAKPLRYTPAGIPASNFVLEHESEIVEGGVTRQVKLTLRAVAFGSLAEQTGQIPLGTRLKFTGFLINARTSKSVVFHVQAIAAITPVSVPAPAS
jgi:primosomal replication protein N